MCVYRQLNTSTTMCKEGTILLKICFYHFGTEGLFAMAVHVTSLACIKAANLILE